MKSQRFIRLLVLPLSLLMYSPATQAQDNSVRDRTDPNAPIAPVQPLPQIPEQQDNDSGSRQTVVPAARIISVADGPVQGSGQSVPDTHVLSSGEMAGTGSSYSLGAILDPVVRFSQAADTAIVPGHLNSISLIGGGLSYDRRSGRNYMAVIYNGAKSYYRPDSLYDENDHRFAIAYELNSGRWLLRARNDALLSPQSSFAGLDSSGSATNRLLPPISPSLVSGSTILTGRAERFDNTSLGEINYAFSRRAVLTFVGTHQLLHFLDPGYIDGRQIATRVGYNYSLSQRDSIALMAGYDRFSFNGVSSLAQNQSLQVSFGRKIAGRMALQVAAGPQFNLFSNSGVHTQHLSWTASSGLTLQTRRNNYIFAISHGATGGSGVILGAESNTATATMDRRFGRSWSAALTGGIALTKPLPGSATTTVGNFRNWTGGAVLSHQLDRHTVIGMNYQFQKQSQRDGTCPVLNCGSTNFRNRLGLTLEWHPMQIQAQ